MRKFSAEGAQLPPQAPSLWGGDTLSYPTPQVSPLQLDSGYATDNRPAIIISVDKQNISVNIARLFFNL